jgi:hypothetical protein
VAVEGLGHYAELNDEIAGEVLWLDLAVFLPKAEMAPKFTPSSCRAIAPLDHPRATGACGVGVKWTHGALDDLLRDHDLLDAF